MSAADQEDHGVEVDERACTCAPRSTPRIEPEGRWGSRVLEQDRRCEDQDRDDGDEGHRHRAQDVGRTSFQQQIDRALGQGVAAEEGSGDVPGLVEEDRVAEESDRAFQGGAQAVGENACGPPQEMGTTSPLDSTGASGW